MGTFQYVQPTAEQLVTMQKYRDRFEALATEIQQELPSSRGLSLALTNLEQSAMWLNKAITKND